ncbi:MAG: 2-C-methyl-D-erythritol 4-phosphate cytidylyltransferase [Helicobacter sp.]|nr:2-C-methyl-D-erythritol 4-phosphate cytidylyltransferase [Helicobacter sp.]
MTTYAIILASGSGSWYGSGVPKQFIKIAGKTLLEHTVEIFEAA